MPLDPIFAAQLISAVDTRFNQLSKMQPYSAYGTVAGVNTTTRKASVYLSGDVNASGGFSFPLWNTPRIGNRVRVVIDPRGDRYIDEVYTGALVAASEALLFQEVFLTNTGTVVTSAGVDATIHSGTFTVTYPGNPEMAGKLVVIRAHADLSLFVNQIGELTVSLHSDVAPIGGSTRLRFTRDRVDTASTWNHTYTSRTAVWAADDPVSFHTSVRTAAAATVSPYSSASADYVSRLGYEVVGYV